jgi:hypothetical protein
VPPVKSVVIVEFIVVVEVKKTTFGLLVISQQFSLFEVTCMAAVPLNGDVAIVVKPYTRFECICVMVGVVPPVFMHPVLPPISQIPGSSDFEFHTTPGEPDVRETALAMGTAFHLYSPTHPAQAIALAKAVCVPEPAELVLMNVPAFKFARELATLKAFALIGAM